MIETSSDLRIVFYRIWQSSENDQKRSPGFRKSSKIFGK